MATFRVFIIEYDMNKLSDATREAARTEVERELNALTATSKNQAVKKGFEVLWPKSQDIPAAADCNPETSSPT